MTEKEKAEAYVRGKLPDMKYDSGAPVGSGYMVEVPIQLQHWLSVIDQRLKPELTFYGSLVVLRTNNRIDGFTFDLRTGQPYKPYDYSVFNQLCT